MNVTRAIALTIIETQVLKFIYPPYILDVVVVINSVSASAACGSYWT
jgi:hypothetical protein